MAVLKMADLQAAYTNSADVRKNKLMPKDEKIRCVSLVITKPVEVKRRKHKNADSLQKIRELLLPFLISGKKNKEAIDAVCVDHNITYENGIPLSYKALTVICTRMRKDKKNKIPAFLTLTDKVLYLINKGYDDKQIMEMLDITKANLANVKWNRDAFGRKGRNTKSIKSINEFIKKDGK